MSYTPKRGGSVAVMLDALQRVDGMTSAELAAAGGVRTKAISALMACAVKAGLVDRATEDKRVRYRWRGARTVAEAAPTIAWPFSSMPAKAAGGEAEQLPVAHEDDQTAECQFAVALWDDGELDIFGGGEFEQNGVPGVRLHRDQVAQLRRLLNHFAPDGQTMADC